jgi:hypothetical protein
MSSWERRTLAASRKTARRAPPEIVGVRCGANLHRIRFVEHGPVVLLDHPRLDLEVERALIALGMPRPDCLLVLDAIAGRVSPNRILGRKRPCGYARSAQRRMVDRATRRSKDVLEQPLVERYAGFVRQRAAYWLDRLLPAGVEFNVLVVPPPGVPPCPRLPSSVWSHRRWSGATNSWRGCLTVHVPIDWCLTVERLHMNGATGSFMIEARTDRRSTLVKRLSQVHVDRLYYRTTDWRAVVEALDLGSPAYPRRWQRASRPPRVASPVPLSC